MKQSRYGKRERGIRPIRAMARKNSGNQMVAALRADEGAERARKEKWRVPRSWGKTRRGMERSRLAHDPGNGSATTAFPRRHYRGRRQLGAAIHGQVFGLTGGPQLNRGFLLTIASRPFWISAFIELRARWMAVVPEYRCGAVPDFHASLNEIGFNRAGRSLGVSPCARVPFSSISDRNAQNRTCEFTERSVTRVDLEWQSYRIHIRARRQRKPTYLF